MTKQVPLPVASKIITCHYFFVNIVMLLLPNPPREKVLVLISTPTQPILSFLYIKTSFIDIQIYGRCREEKPFIFCSGLLCCQETHLFLMSLLMHGHRVSSRSDFYKSQLYRGKCSRAARLLSDSALRNLLHRLYIQYIYTLTLYLL